MSINLDWIKVAEKGLTEADVAYTQHLGDLEELQQGGGIRKPDRRLVGWLPPEARKKKWTILPSPFEHQ